MNQPVLRIILCCAAIFTANQLFAFKADEPVSAKTANAVILKAAPQKMPTDDQKAALKSLDGVTVEWDDKTGAPASIRGNDLASKNIGGKGLALNASRNAPEDAIAVMDCLASVYRLRDASNEFSIVKSDTDKFGFRHVRLNQIYKGLRVVGAEVIVHFNKSGQAYQVNGRYIPSIDLEINPAIDREKALTTAQSDLAKSGKPAGTLRGSVELVIYARNTEPALAYELMLVYDDKQAGTGRWRYWINANDGTIINKYNDIRKDGYYYMRNTASHWEIYDYPNHSIARNNTANWPTDISGRGEMSAAYNFNKIQTYYFNIHSRNSYDNLGAKARANVHYHVSGDDYDNAFWDPDSQQFYFYPGSYYAELTVLDVCAHEFTHAVTENTANLVYQDEPGALNESFSDVFGTAVEFACQPDGRSAYPDRIAGWADWLLGEDCTYPTGDAALRDMRNPLRYNNPSKYHGTDWYYGSGDYGGVHYNCGVQNHFFYLLSEGGSGNNDGISYDIIGIGITNAAAIAYRALTVYCTPDTDYAAARTAWISAAADLNASWIAAVQQAWAAVGVSGSAPVHSISAKAKNDAMITGLLLTGKANTAIGLAESTIHSSSAKANAVAATITGSLLTGEGGTAVSVTGTTTSYASNMRAQGLNNDFDNDNKADYALYKYQYGNWYIYSSLSGWLANGEIFGESNFLPVPGDYNGDGKADVVVYSRSTGWWMVYYTGTSRVNTFQSGGNECIPAPGDYDGDGKTDFALYNFVSGAWYIFSSLRHTWITYGNQLGGYGYIPVPGDYDGGGMSDVVVYSEELALWLLYYTETGTQNYCDFSEVFGNYRYFVPAPGDYDGDGITDFGLYDYLRGYWYIWSPVNSWIKYDFKWADYDGYYYSPVAGDYDGDGISDIAVYSRYYGDFFIYYLGSGASAHLTDTGFGGDQYVPITYWALYWYM